jgi:hypothetical protein
MAKTKPTTIDQIDPSHLIGESVLLDMLGWTVSEIDAYMPLPDAYTHNEDDGKQQRHFRADRVATVTRQENLQLTLDAERDRLAQCTKAQP